MDNKNIGLMNNEMNKNMSTKKLLADDERPAFEIVNANGSSNFVLVCDHASKRVPRSLSKLGLTTDQLDDHIGWDPGAADVARLLSQNLNAPLVLSGYSRLVIDCNRPLQSVQSIPEQSAGVLIQGCSLGGSHGSWGFVGRRMGTDRPVAAF